MTEKQIEEYCGSKKGAVVEYKPEWECLWGHIEGKMFVLIGGDKEKNKCVSLKCEPELAEIYRKEYKDVVPGYYLNKQHWNSIYYPKETVSDELIKEMIDMSYTLVFNKLPKKVRESIEQE